MVDALLEIYQYEAGCKARHFHKVDLWELSQTVVRELTPLAMTKVISMKDYTAQDCSLRLRSGSVPLGFAQGAISSWLSGAEASGYYHCWKSPKGLALNLTLVGFTNKTSLWVNSDLASPLKRPPNLGDTVGEFRIGLAPHCPKAAFSVPLVDFARVDLDFQSGSG